MGSSTTPSASEASRQWATASGEVTAASAWPLATCRAASALEYAGRNSTPGRCAASHCRTWAAATGNAARVRTSAALLPGLTTMLNATSSVVSANTCSGEPMARLSRVGVTEPSIEFSIGTHA